MNKQNEKSWPERNTSYILGWAIVMTLICIVLAVSTTKTNTSEVDCVESCLNLGSDQDAAVYAEEVVFCALKDNGDSWALWTAVEPRVESFWIEREFCEKWTK